MGDAHEFGHGQGHGHGKDGDVWIRETRFGTWFIGTWVWAEYVLGRALADLERVLTPRRASYPTVLELGCGVGKALPLLLARFLPGRLIGIDIDPAAIARAREQAIGLDANVELHRTHAGDLPVGGAEVDLVFCHQTFHHFPDQERVLAEVRRVLRPGGVLLMAESCRDFICTRRVRWLFRHPMEVQRTPAQYLALLREAGFTFDERNVELPYTWWSRPDMGLSQLLGRPLPEHPPETVLHVAAFRP